MTGRRARRAARSRWGYALAIAVLGCGGNPEPAPVPPEVEPGAAAPAVFLPDLDGDRALIEGLALRESGDLEGARSRLLQAALLGPAGGPAEVELRRVEDALHERLLADGRALLARGAVREAGEKIRRASTLPRGRGPGSAAAALLGGLRYADYWGEWLPRDEVIRREKAEDRRARVRREELGLGEAFFLDRRGDIRIYTDAPASSVLPLTRRLHRLVGSVRETYRRMLAPLVVPGEWGSGGIDIVIAARREEYEEMTGTSHTVGMFLPLRGASFFYFGDEPSFDAGVPVLLHELCHQLDWRVLGSRFPPPWLQEGLAVCWEGARLSDDGTVESVGDLPPDALSRAREAISAGGDRRWTMERLARTEVVTGLHGTDAVHDFYAQAALAASVLLRGRLAPRALLYDLLDRARRADARPERAWRDLQEAFGAHGETPSGFDAKLERAAGAAAG